MTDEKRLFDKSMDELREAFVRNRFGQTDVFGLANIETWLQYQRTIERSDEVMWQSYLTRNFLEVCAGTAPLTHLHERATTQHVPGTADHIYWQIYFQFRSGLYLGHRDVGMYAPAGQQEMFVLNEVDGKLTIERIGDASTLVGTRAVLSVLFAEWLHKRPKWEKAREFLCDALAEEIKCERAKAEADFDTAVAVSADGTKIVHADFIVVLGTAASEDVWFPADAFRVNKALRVSERCSFHCMDDTWSTKPAATDFLRRSAAKHPIDTAYGMAVAHPRLKREQHFVRCTDARILFIPREHCPSPLPDGGVAVTV